MGLTGGKQGGEGNGQDGDGPSNLAALEFPPPSCGNVGWRGVLGPPEERRIDLTSVGVLEPTCGGQADPSYRALRAVLAVGSALGAMAVEDGEYLEVLRAAGGLLGGDDVVQVGDGDLDPLNPDAVGPASELTVAVGEAAGPE